ncbi:phosphotransferase family protein [Streptomyces sp. XD-27]|uniref:phosphotransferase family protein n=1 Tax=Streptomyces sp. XD-27 TaxID=3062779 RepID=UPI0026F42432|nr:aminoglycoside phosphotransferase family protein [Streptomyces sp. XD-27]WKX68677.1 aminoglycoside phosphotransferase family protein [Streptomyces sp. XD-27]
MSYRPIQRESGAFQQPVTEDEIDAMCRRAFGPGTEVVSAVELGDGYYNNTFRVEIGARRPVILRVAPDPARQTRAEPELMRNEHASIPYLAPIASLLPRTLVVDFTHDVIGRDYLFQTLLDGVPAPEGLHAYPRTEWRPFFRRLGEIARSIHSVRGTGFGRVAGPAHATWSHALFAWFEDVAADLTDAGLDAEDIGLVVKLADRNRAVLDAIDGPRLLHGDLWVGNTMVAPGAPEPTINGVFDCDRIWWGDPEADWPIYLARRRPGTERDAFWEGYGPVGTTPEARWRSLVYQARHAAALRVEYHRFGWQKETAETYSEMQELIGKLRTGI